MDKKEKMEKVFDIKTLTSNFSTSCLKEYSNIKIGEEARYLFIPQTYNELRKIIKKARKENYEILPLGGCSNILFGNIGNRFLILDQKLPKSFHVNRDEVVVSANYNLNEFILTLQDHELGGLEFLYGIPAHLGGAVFMNAGAFGHNISEFVNWIEVMDRSGKLMIFDKEELEFNYRKTSIDGSSIDGFILTVGLDLKAKSRKKINSDLQEYLSKRKERHPYNFPSLGSIFKNPEGKPAGKLIEECGLKGQSFGDAEVSKKHANFIINKGNATFQNVMDLIKLCREKVYEKHQIKLETEIKVIN